MSSKNKLILLFPDTTEGLDRITVPLNLLALAAVLERDKVPFEIIDSRIEKDYKKKIFTSIKEGALALGMGVQTGPQIGHALDICRAVKKEWPEFPIIWGGWHGSILPEQTVMDESVDYVVIGQGEKTIIELYDVLKNSGDPANVSGLAYKKDGKAILTTPRPITGLEDFPPLPFHHVDLKRYPGRKTGEGRIFTTYRTSQGCPWRCSYCADPLVFDRRWKGLGAKRIVDELEELNKKYGVNEILFVDDTFIVSPKRVRDMCEEMLRRDLKIEWQACARTGMIVKMEQEDIDLMEKAGCVQIHPGVEAPSQEMLDYIKKDEKNDNTIIAAEKLAKAGIRALYSFMVSYPKEPDDTVDLTFEMIIKLKKIDTNNVCPVNFFVPFPGNPIFEAAVEKGLKRPETLEEWNFFNTRSGTSTPWVKSHVRDKVIKMDKYYLPAAFPSETLKGKMEKGAFKLVYRFFHKMAKHRVDNNSFGFCWDWKLLYAYWKFWEKFNRKIPLHNIHFR